MNTLAALLKANARYAEAEALYKRLIALVERLHSPDYSELGIELTNLADLYNQVGNDPEAEALLLRSVSIQEKALERPASSTSEELNR